MKGVIVVLLIGLAAAFSFALPRSFLLAVRTPPSLTPSSLERIDTDAQRRFN